MNYQTVSATHYRKRAKRMRKLAADEPEDVRDELLELADDYDHIALLAAKASRETNYAASKAQRQ